MRLALVIAIYNRHDLESLVIERYKEQSKKYGFEIIIAGSEGKTSQKIANGCHYIEIKNYPVSVKHNALIEKAKELNVDCVVLSGSDNIVNDKYWEFIYGLSNNEKEIIGFKDLYFYLTETKELGYFKGYAECRQSIGVGRFFSRYVLDTMNWKLWSDKKNRGLDTDCNTLLQKKGIFERIYTMEETDVFILDIKHTRSITNKNIIELTEKVNLNIMAKKVGEPTAKKIKALKSEIVNIKDIDFGNAKDIEVIGTGKSKFMPDGDAFTVTVEMAKILIEKGSARL